MADLLLSISQHCCNLKSLLVTYQEWMDVVKCVKLLHDVAEKCPALDSITLISTSMVKSSRGYLSHLQTAALRD